VLLVSTLPAESFSITVAGGMRPAAPMIVTGIAAPGPPGVTTGLTISVMVRLSNALLPGSHEGVQPARNSWTRPLTVTAVPTVAAAGGAELVKTKMPSEVAGSVSGAGSCM
jgi:hypothetical protein